MRRLHLSYFLLIIGFVLSNASAKTVILHVFSGAEGSATLGPLVSDNAGNLYGVNSSGAAGFGTVFELSPPAVVGGNWVSTILYTFSGTTDGAYPNGGLTFDAQGNLYGTTLQGGACVNGYCGVVFQLAPPANGGGWTYSRIYAFPANQGFPNGSLAIDAQGNLYGTAQFGGDQAFGLGYVFELSPPQHPGEIWAETNIHNFQGYPSDGALPYNVILDAQGNLFGTTSQGGSGACFNAGTFIGCGTAFELTRNGSNWTETIIHEFRLAENFPPYSGLTLSASGILYGAAGYSIYRLEHSGQTWTRSDVYVFPEGINGTAPNSPPTLDAAGNLYGTSRPGGIEGFGTAYRLTLSNTLPFQEITLSTFPQYSAFQPDGGLIIRKGEGLYGVANSQGVKTQAGYVFEIVAK